MTAILHFDLTHARLHPAFDSLDLELGRRGQDLKGNETFKLNKAASECARLCVMERLNCFLGTVIQRRVSILSLKMMY
jgi:hypothetical protein